MSERPLLPQSIEAEQAIVGYVMNYGRDALAEAKSVFKPEWLHKPAHRLLWQLCEDVDKTTDLWSTQEIMVRALACGAIDSLGGPAELLEVSSQGAVSHAHLPFFADIAKTRWEQRKTLDAVQKLTEACHGDPETFRDAVFDAWEGISSAFDASRGSRLRTGAEIVPAVLQELENASDRREENPDWSRWVKSGIGPIDEKIGGLVRDHWVIGGATSGGKSVFSIQLAISALRAGQNVVIFTFEMDAEELIRRMMSLGGPILFSNINECQLTHGDLQRLTDVSSLLATGRLKFYDKPATIGEIQAICKAENTRAPIDFILVDYIQRVKSDARKGESKQQEIARISAGLKELQRELGCLLISPTQLNDQGETREARDIIFDAAIGLRIEEEGIFVAKNRNGPRDYHLNLWLNGQYQRFEPAQQPKKVSQ